MSAQTLINKGWIFVKSTDSFGPYVNGMTYDEGRLIAPDARFVDVLNSMVGIRPRLVGDWIEASRHNGTVSVSGEIQTTPEPTAEEKAEAARIGELYGWKIAA
jgi:hypothetical protein